MKDLDKLAYHIVCNWHQAIGFNPINNGVDYSIIVRYYLWDKIGRAFRVKHGTSCDEISKYLKEYKSFPFYHQPLKSQGSYKKPLFFDNKKVIFIPFITRHTNAIIKELNATKKCKVISKQISSLTPKNSVIKSLKFEEDQALGVQIYSKIIESLKTFDIELISEDKALLKEQVIGAVAITQLAEKELLKYKPNSLYLHSDNHPPFINYVLVAKKTWNTNNYISTRFRL